MITIDCTWCDAELVLDSLDATSVDCRECQVSVEIVADPEPVAIAA
jgi:hypothetical protein